MGVNNKGLAEYFREQGIGFETIDGWESRDELIGKLDNYDVIFRTPGLPYLSRAVQQAKEKGVEIYSQTKLFFDLCPAKIIGVTGTKGKGTTATLIYEILKTNALRPSLAPVRRSGQAQGQKVFLAGNIGEDPFQFLDKLGKDDWVILELSSFQLQDLRKSPHIAVVLKITPDHLDHHKTFEEYRKAKDNIVKYQKEGDIKIQNSKLDPRIREDEVGLLGKFNLQNVAAAVAAVKAAGVKDMEVVRKVVRDFKGLPHRLEFVAEKGGVKYYDDSFSTTPETAMAALTAFDTPIILIAGGSEKNSDYTELGKTIADSKVKALLAVGTTGPKIANAAVAAGFKGRIVKGGLNSMEKIVAEAKKLARPGDVVLLSPASASFDMFHDYKDRGELFQKFVKHL